MPKKPQEFQIPPMPPRGTPEWSEWYDRYGGMPSKDKARREARAGKLQHRNLSRKRERELRDLAVFKANPGYATDRRRLFKTPVGVFTDWAYCESVMTSFKLLGEGKVDKISEFDLSELLSAIFPHIDQKVWYIPDLIQHASAYAVFMQAFPHPVYEWLICHGARTQIGKLTGKPDEREYRIPLRQFELMAEAASLLPTNYEDLNCEDFVVGDSEKAVEAVRNLINLKIALTEGGCEARKDPKSRRFAVWRTSANGIPFKVTGNTMALALGRGYHELVRLKGVDVKPANEYGDDHGDF